MRDKQEVMIVDSRNKNLTSLTYLPRQPSEKWKPEETQKFYKALQIFGTDFSLIEKVFNKSRTRDQIKVTISICHLLYSIEQVSKRGEEEQEAYR
jgi:hypothetical protein